MAIEIAMDDDRLRKLRGAPLNPRAAPAAPQVQQRKSAGSQMMDIASNKAMNKASDTFIDPMINKGMSKAGELASFVSPQAMTGAQLDALQGASAGKAMSASGMLGGGMSPGMAQAVLGSGKAAAPLVAQTAGMTGGKLAAATAPSLTRAATTNAATAAGGISPMLAALGPIGLGIGGLMLAKKFGLFSGGGHVGPLYSYSGSNVSPLRKYPTAATTTTIPPATASTTTTPLATATTPYNTGFRPVTTTTPTTTISPATVTTTPATAPTTPVNPFTLTASVTPPTIFDSSLNAPVKLVYGEDPDPYAYKPTEVTEYYTTPFLGQTIYSEHESPEMNLDMWNWQNKDSGSEYYVMSGGDDMGMVPVGGWDNYWNVMNQASGGDALYDALGQPTGIANE